MKSVSNCFTLPPNINFLYELVKYILTNYKGTDLINLLVLLPNRRSCRVMRDIFLDCADGKPLLLPRILGIGDIEEEIFFPDILDISLDACRPIDKTRRHFLLTKLVADFHDKGEKGHNISQSVELARELAGLIDEVHRNRIDLTKLSTLVPDNLASHWQMTLDFLSIISDSWQKILENDNVVDPAHYHVTLLSSVCKLWENNPPTYPVIAAGSTGSQPAVADLLKVIASLPNGKVILPHLDKNMGDTDWEIIGKTHPQYTLKDLLGRMKISRVDVGYLCEPSTDSSHMEDYIRAIFLPAESTAFWKNIELPPPEALSGIGFLETESEFDEALSIAISMREVLETPSKTGVLITNDRKLARMVSNQLWRFGIAIDDSAGSKLADCPQGCFLRLCADMIACRASPVKLLALLRHPLAAGGMSPAKCRKLSRELELLLLRGVRVEKSISGLLEAAVSNERISDDLINFLTIFEEKSRKFFEFFITESKGKIQKAKFEELLAEHIRFATWLASTDEKNGDDILWENEAGKAMSDVITGWLAQSDIFPMTDPMIYPFLFDSLLADETYRPFLNIHPRLHILSPVEARLQNYDYVILGGLNEGVWPQNQKTDSWMSRAQRDELGLPPHEKIIGQGAHDFSGWLFAKEVLLTRAKKDSGVPTMPSRWWVRMTTLLSSRHPEKFRGMSKYSYFAKAKEYIEKPANIDLISAPSPRPPISSRPNKLPVTAVDKWIKEPYYIYARYILNLKKLDDLDRQPNSADFGIMVHKVMEKFNKDYQGKINKNDIRGYILGLFEAELKEFANKPSVVCLWRPRFIAVIDWLASQEESRRKNVNSVIYSEVNSSYSCDIDDKKFTLTARIDRLELLEDGSYILVDYKTGNIPKQSDIKKGEANQLPLSSFIVKNGDCYANSIKLKNSDVSRMEYWRIVPDKTEINVANTDADKAMCEFVNLTREFNNEDMPYKVREFSDDAYNDYEHLIRRSEWEG
ncbi:MAG: double-strand break repair protein AddB [Rickettsiales bacterium]